MVMHIMYVILDGERNLGNESMSFIPVIDENAFVDVLQFIITITILLV